MMLPLVTYVTVTCDRTVIRCRLSRSPLHSFTRQTTFTTAINPTSPLTKAFPAHLCPRPLSDRRPQTFPSTAQKASATSELWSFSHQKRLDPGLQFESAVPVVDASETLPVAELTPANVIDAEQAIDKREGLITAKSPSVHPPSSTLAMLIRGVKLRR